MERVDSVSAADGHKVIVLIEDEVNLLNSLAFILENQGFSVLRAQTGEEGVQLILSRNPALTLVDINLPGMDGFEVATRVSDLRERIGMKVVFLTASDDEDDMVRAFEGLADDYVVKPVRPRVLVARLNALLSSPRMFSEEKDISFGPLVMSPTSFEASLNGQNLDLTPTEFRILWLLVNHPGKVLSRSQIIDEVHGKDCFLTEKSIDFQIHGLRRKMGEHSCMLMTVRGVGFKLSPVDG